MVKVVNSVALVEILNGFSIQSLPYYYSETENSVGPNFVHSENIVPEMLPWPQEVLKCVVLREPPTKQK